MIVGFYSLRLLECGRVAVLVSRRSRVARFAGTGAVRFARLLTLREKQKRVCHERVRGVTVHAPALILCFWPCCRTSTAQHKAKALLWLSDGSVPDGERARQINLDIKVSIIPEYQNLNFHESAESLSHSLQRTVHNYQFG